MKRDVDIIRKIAFATESLPSGECLDAIDGIDPADFSAHVEWMSDAGLVEAHIDRMLSGEHIAVVLRLTWAGCDFLDAARSETLWAKAKRSVIAPASSWTFGILLDWLKAEIRDGLPSLRGPSG